VSSSYNYNSNVKSTYDFILEVFQKNFIPTSSKVTVNRSSEVLLGSWKDARSFDKTYRALVAKVEADLNISADVQNLDINELVNEDVFECIDKQIIKELALQIEQGSIGTEKVDTILKQRESCYWYDKYFEFYSSLQFGNWLFDEILKYKTVKIEDYSDGFDQYTKKWYLSESS
jgi:hypothetical protein